MSNARQVQFGSRLLFDVHRAVPIHDFSGVVHSAILTGRKHKRSSVSETFEISAHLVVGGADSVQLPLQIDLVIEPRKAHHPGYLETRRLFKNTYVFPRKTEAFDLLDDLVNESGIPE
jgi:hypothetical protein